MSLPFSKLSPLLGCGTLLCSVSTLHVLPRICKGWDVFVLGPGEMGLIPKRRSEVPPGQPFLLPDPGHLPAQPLVVTPGTTTVHTSLSVTPSCCLHWEDLQSRWSRRRLVPCPGQVLRGLTPVFSGVTWIPSSLNGLCGLGLSSQIPVHYNCVSKS